MNLIGIFKRKKQTGGDFFRNIPLCTVKIITEADFKAFCDYGFKNRMYINYALSDSSQWKTIEAIPDCFAVVNYAPNAGCGHKIRVDFVIWGPYSAKGLGEKFEMAHVNYDCVADFVAGFAPDMLYWLLYEKFGDKRKWAKI